MVPGVLELQVAQRRTRSCSIEAFSAVVPLGEALLAAVAFSAFLAMARLSQFHHEVGVAEATGATSARMMLTTPAMHLRPCQALNFSCSGITGGEEVGEEVAAQDTQNVISR